MEVFLAPLLTPLISVPLRAMSSKLEYDIEINNNRADIDYYEEQKKIEFSCTS